MQADEGSRWTRRVAATSAVLLTLAAVWVAAFELGLTVSSPPPFDSGTDAELEAWYAWVATTLPQRRLARLLLAVGLAGVGLTALRTAAVAWGSRAGAVCVAVGAGVWCLADLTQAGGQEAVRQLAGSGNPISAVASVAYTVDVTTAWVEAGGSVLLGLGAAAMGRTFLHEPRTRRLGVCSALVALAGVIFGAMIIAPDVDATPAGVTLGAVLLPIWVVWLSRVPQPTATGDHGIAATITVGG